MTSAGFSPSPVRNNEIWAASSISPGLAVERPRESRLFRYQRGGVRARNHQKPSAPRVPNCRWATTTWQSFPILSPPPSADFYNKLLLLAISSPHTGAINNACSEPLLLISGSWDERRLGRRTGGFKVPSLSSRGRACPAALRVQRRPATGGGFDRCS